MQGKYKLDNGPFIRETYQKFFAPHKILKFYLDGFLKVVSRIKNFRRHLLLSPDTCIFTKFLNKEENPFPFPPKNVFFRQNHSKLE